MQHNYRTPWCEIDLITLDENFSLHVVEVKNWTSRTVLHHPLEVFSDKRRIAKIQSATKQFIESFNSDNQLQQTISQLYCKLSLYEMDVSFDLLWLRQDNHIEYYQKIF